MSFREKTNKEVLVFQSTGLGMIIAEPSFWKALILQHLVNLCLSGEKDMPFLSLCICCAAVQNTPYTFLLLALPTLSWRLSFSLCLDCHVWVSPHLCKISSFSMFPQPPSAKFIFFLMVHNFPFFCMENNYSDCGFAPTNPLISSSLIGSLLCPMQSYGFWLHETSRLFFHATLSVNLWGKHVCFAFSTYFLIKKLTLRRGMNSPFWQRLSFDWLKCLKLILKQDYKTLMLS